MYNIESNLIKIKELINNINDECDLYDMDKYQVKKYEIVYLEELEGMLRSYFNGIILLNFINKNDEKFIRVNDRDIDYYTIRKIVSNNSRQIRERLRVLNLDIPKIFLECNYDNHGLSKRNQIYLKNKKYFDNKEALEFYNQTKEDIFEISRLFVEFLEKYNLNDGLNNNVIKRIKKDNNIVLENEFNTLEKFDTNFSTNHIELNEILEKFAAIDNLDKERKILILDSIFRIFEAKHLLSINSSINLKGGIFVDLKYKNIISAIEIFLMNDTLVNTSVMNISSVYDKLSKEILDSKSYEERIYFKEIYTSNNKRACYSDIEYLDFYNNMQLFSKKIFDLKNMFLHYSLPCRMLDKLNLEEYSLYKENLINININFLILLLNYIYKNIK